MEKGTMKQGTADFQGTRGASSDVTHTEGTLPAHSLLCLD